MILIKILITASKTKSHALLETPSFSWCLEHFTNFSSPLLMSLPFPEFKRMKFPQWSPQSSISIYTLFLDDLILTSLSVTEKCACLMNDFPLQPQAHISDILLDIPTWIFQRNSMLTWPKQKSQSLECTPSHNLAPHFSKW